MSTIPLPVSTGSLEGEQEGIRLVKGVVVAWEKLRLVYNLVLLVPGIVVAAMYYHHYAPYVSQGAHGGVPAAALVIFTVVSSVLYGIGANICYCLGPYVEFVVLARGFPVTRRKIRPFLFGLGLVLSLFLMIVGGLFFLGA